AEPLPSRSPLESAVLGTPLFGPPWLPAALVLPGLLGGGEDRQPSAAHQLPTDRAPVRVGRTPPTSHSPARRLQLVRQVEDLLTQLLHLVLQLQDPFDPGEVDTFLLRQALHLTQRLNIAHGVPASTTGRTAWRDDPQSVVLPQSLRVHTGQLGGHRDHIDRRMSAEGRRVHVLRAPFARHARPSRESGSDVADRNFSSASRASLLSVCGTSTSKVTIMSPGVPSPRVAPLPRTRSLRPFCVPGGTFTVTGKPLMVGTRTSAPNAASGTVTGMVMVTLSPLRPNTACSFTWTTTYRSPFGPPFSPGAPLP